MEYQATAKYIRVSPRKMRLVADAVRKITPGQALTRLALVPKSAVEPFLKVLKSAIANAQVKSVEIGALRFAKIEVMGGPALKRYNAISRGSGHSYKKRMCHVQIVLSDGADTNPEKSELKPVKTKKILALQDGGNKNGS